MKFNFLTHILITNNLFKSMATAAVIVSSPALADTPNLNSATAVAVSGESIDFESKIAQIDAKIIKIETKISIIEQKSELTSSDKRDRYNLNKEFKKLTAEKLAIVDNENKQLDKTIARIDNENKQLDKTIAIKLNEGKQLDKKLDIAEKKLEALNRVSKILTK